MDSDFAIRKMRLPTSIASCADPLRPCQVAGDPRYQVERA